MFTGVDSARTEHLPGMHRARAVLVPCFATRGSAKTGMVSAFAAEGFLGHRTLLAGHRENTVHVPCACLQSLCEYRSHTELAEKSGTSITVDADFLIRHVPAKFVLDRTLCGLLL